MTENLSQFLQSFQDYSAQGLEIQLCVEFAEMPREIYKKVFVKNDQSWGLTISPIFIHVLIEDFLNQLGIFSW